MVKLQVAINGNVISNTVIFEFKSKVNNTQDAYKRLEIDDLLLTTNLEDTAEVAELQHQDQQETETATRQPQPQQPPRPASLKPPPATHNLYLCNDVNCQRILKTMLLQKFDDLKSHIVEENKSTTMMSGKDTTTIKLTPASKEGRRAFIFYLFLDVS